MSKNQALPDRRVIRIVFITAFIALLATEILIGMYAGGWVRAYLGDVLVIMLIYAGLRGIFPDKPGFGAALPGGILVFSFLTEFLQLLGIADILGITDPLIRIIIGTSFSWYDLLCYTAGAVPAFIAEYALAASAGRKGRTGEKD